jgi:hypothetical protein
MRKFKSFAGSTQEEAEAKARKWAIGQKGLRNLKTQSQLICVGRRSRAAKQEARWETIVQYETPMPSRAF